MSRPLFRPFPYPYFAAKLVLALRAPGVATTAARSLLAISLTSLLGLTTSVHAGPVSPDDSAAPELSTHRLIVKLKDSYQSEFNQPLSEARLQGLAMSAGAKLHNVRPMSGNAHVVEMPQALQGAALNAAVAQLRGDPAVEYAYPDLRQRVASIPNDPLFSSQTALQNATGTAPLIASINAPLAWETTTGSPSVVIAVLDTGVRFDHPDLQGRLLPGYDFVSADCSFPADAGKGCTASNQFFTANDLDGRDADASDPGDWVTSSDAATPFKSYQCNVENSSWHGTRVASVIGATGNNGMGITGVNQNATLLPLRVLGKCGGYSSDAVDAMRWAVGMSVPGIADNTHIARILNASLGGVGPCSSSVYARAIPEILATGAIIVSSAGNENDAVDFPANCPGVIAVGAVRADGMRASYSNSGTEIALTAPGGDSLYPGDSGIMMASNTGTTVPGSTYYDSYFHGTSFAAPMVSGVISLMLSVKPDLTAAQVLAILQQSARPFVSNAAADTCMPGGNGKAPLPCNCTTSACGAGYLDAAGALKQALAVATAPAPAARPVTQSATPAPGDGGAGGGSVDLASLLALLVVVFGSRKARSR